LLGSHVRLWAKLVVVCCRAAQVVKLVDTRDLKSLDRKVMRVRLPPWAPNQYLKIRTNMIREMRAGKLLLILLDLVQELRRTWVVMAGSVAIGIIPVLAVAAVVVWFDIPSAVLVRDPVAVLQGPWYTGFLSQLGIFGWAAAAVSCALAASLLTHRMRQFFIASAALTLLLGLDDAYLLHERVLPEYFGLNELVVYSVYVGLTVTYLALFIRQILLTEYTLLAMAFAFFALSIGMDAAGVSRPGSFLVEDGAKFIGIISMAVYYFRTAAQSIACSAPHPATRFTEPTP
jgi:hypothetical protein